MNKMKGMWLLVCKSPKCANMNGWPLIALRSYSREEHNEGDSNVGDGGISEGKYKYDWEMYCDHEDKLNGVCPNCATPFWFKASGRILGPYSLNDQLHDNVEAHSPHVALVNNIKTEGVHAYHRDVLITEIHDLPSRNGLHTLRPGSKEKQGFIRALRRAQQANLPTEDLPDWTPEASDAQFKAWTRQIDRELFLHDTIPVAVATAGQPLSNEDIPTMRYQMELRARVLERD